jgi:DMSO/TMAO reductase YedYZ molybdopterin-dependent catalytic subunit
MDRRHFLQAVTGATVLPVLRPLHAFGAGATPLTYGLPAGAYGIAQMANLPGKRPLIELTARPPNYEAPMAAFATPITPNDLFFVRYHLAGIPPQIDRQQWRIAVTGDSVATAQQLGFQDLQRDFEQVEVTAVCQCSGNRRGLSDPHVPGVQWGVGAMGNAVWRGPRLKDILAKAGMKPGAIEVVINGADGPVLTTTPDFVKSIPIAKALDDNTIVALQMNGADLPHFNGYPARLIVPGWTGTYWMKHLISVEPVTKPFDGFWMRAAYRIPTGMFPTVQRFATQENEMTTPITEMVVNSLITSPAEGARFRAGQPVSVSGFAWDGGYGIRSVDVSTDNGASWREATLGSDSGRYAFRPWTYQFTPQTAGNQAILASATNRLGETQVRTLIFNGAGYHNNVVRPTTIVIA